MNPHNNHACAARCALMFVNIVFCLVVAAPGLASPFYGVSPHDSPLYLSWADSCCPTSCYALADFNADGKADLATPVISGYSNLDVRLGMGDGTFISWTQYRLNRHATAIDMGDINNDGIADLLIGGESGMSYLLSSGNGAFSREQICSSVSAHNPGNLATADFNEDGIRDIMSDDEYRAGIVVQHLWPSGFARDTLRFLFDLEDFRQSCQMAVGDFDQDGHTDVIGGLENGVCKLLRGRGALGFEVPRDLGPGGTDIASGDFNKDGLLDVTCGRHLYMNQNGTLIRTGELNSDIRAAGDINGDTNLDLVGVSGDSIVVYTGLGDGSFVLSGDIIHVTAPDDIRLADVNGDGMLDLAVSHRNKGLLSIYLAVQAVNLQAEANPNLVRLTWKINSPVSSTIAVERREDAGACETLAYLEPDESRQVQFIDHAVEAGRPYAYRLSWTSTLSAVQAGEVRIDVPAGPDFLLGSPRPNPVSAGSTVDFALPKAADVSLEIYDLTGRRVAIEHLGRVSAGSHRVPLPRLHALNCGVYNLVLRQSSGIKSEKFVLNW
jgi:hypothetical protein